MRRFQRAILPGALALSLMPFAGPSLAQSDDGGDGSAALEGTEWQLMRMEARGPWDMTLGFGPDGELVVATPCFDVDGRYTTQGDVIEIEAAKVEGSGGGESCDIVQQTGGDLLLQSLADAQLWAIDAAGVLTILPASGGAASELTLEPFGAPELADSPTPDSVTGLWVLVAIIDQVGELASLPEGLEITLELDDMGVLSGSAGCSAYAGTYAFDESAALSIAGLTVDEVVDCDPMFAGWQQDFLRLFESVDESTIDGDQLVLGTDPWGFDLYFEAAD